MNLESLKTEINQIDKLLNIIDELNDWEYQFVMDMAERSHLTKRQADLIDKMVYDKIEVYL